MRRAAAKAAELPARAKRSFAYRVAAPCKLMLAMLPPRIPDSGAPVDLTVLTFCGAAHGAMLREWASSLANAWPDRPRLRVVSDGSLAPAVAAELGRLWQGGVEVIHWQELVANLDPERHAALIRFAARDAMGAKMLAVLSTAMTGPTLYSDVDLLWYRRPPTLDGLLASGGPQLVMSVDFQPMYDGRLVPARLPDLGRPPYYCAGFLYAAGDVLAACDVWSLLDFAAENGIGVTEQTIFAEATRQLGGHSWPAEEVALLVDDRFSIAPSFLGKTWAARHYVGNVRHLMWKDALALRLGLKAGEREPQELGAG